MKRFLFLTLALLVALSVAWAVDYELIRPEGVNADPGNHVYVLVDSTDTLEVDTSYSDTFVVDSAVDYVNIALALTGFTACDSCNDSVLVIVKTLTSFNGITPQTRYTDTFTTTLDSTEVLRHNFYVDTTLENLLWFETVIKDSVIIGNTNPDSIRIQLQYHVLTK